MTGLLTAEVSAMVGHTVTYTAPEPLSSASIRHFALAIGSDPQRWVDEAPPTLICETNQLTGNAERDESGYIGHLWELPLPVACVMIRGGNDYRFHRPVRPDDVITTTWRIESIEEVQDASGGPLLVVTAVAAYTAADGEVVADNTETLLYRPAASHE